MRALLSPEVEDLILEEVSSGRYRSADEVVRLGLTLLQRDEHREAKTAPKALANLAGRFAEIAQDVPDSEWLEVPDDLSQNLDKYLYGNHKNR
jgi:putative addiction module CopG family antidote